MSIFDGPDVPDEPTEDELEQSRKEDLASKRENINAQAVAAAKRRGRSSLVTGVFVPKPSGSNNPTV